MQKNKRMHRVNKAVGLFCALVLLVCALYVPVVFGASAIASVEIADNTPVVFDFEDTVTDSNINKAEAVANGAGYFGWGPAVKTNTEGDVTNKVLSSMKNNADASWATSGGYRLHKKLEDGSYAFYELAPNSEYMVSMKIRVLSSPVTISGSKDTYTSLISLGYNAYFNAGDANQSTSYVNAMSQVKTIVESKIDSNSFVLYDFQGNGTTYECGETWYNVSYFLNAPAEFTKDPALAIWGTNYHGWACEIDDVTVTKIGEGMGKIILVDEYAGYKEAFLGKVGDTFQIPDIADRASNPEHVFEGWYTDADRTVPAGNVVYGEEEVVLYSRWKSPVTVTFKDTLNGTETSVSGSAGETVNYPADPVDPTDKSWFMGWYTDETHTTEYISTKFGYSNITVYSYWKGEIPSVTQDFENYTYDAWTPMNVSQNNGTAEDKSDDYPAVYKSNYLYFWTTLSKQSEQVVSGENAIKFHWNTDPAVNKDVSKPDGQNISNPESYAHSRFASWDNYFPIGKGLDNDTKYNVTFKYKVEQGNQNVTFYLRSAAAGNIWAGGVTYADSQTVALKPGDWQEYTFSFTTNMANATDMMFMGIKLSSHDDVIMYIDDVKLEPFAQPYESVATIDTGIDGQVISLKGKRGEKIEIPVLTHPMEAEFKGWYLDKDFTVPAEAEPVYVRGELKLYAKWLGFSGFIQDFENYTYDAWTPSTFTKDNGTTEDKSDDYTAVYKSNYLIFYTTMSKQSDVVYGGNNAIKFHWNTDPKLNKDVSKSDGYNIKNPESYEQSRYTAYDNLFDLGAGLENNQVYTITFKYKVEKGEQDVKFYTLTANSGNSWAGRKIYNAPENVTIKPGDWQEYSFQFTTSMSSTSQHLYFGVVLSENSDVVMYFDDFKLKSVLNTEQVYMHLNNGYEGTTEPQILIKGEKLVLPNLVHPENAEFLGWYSDSAFTTPFNETVVPQHNFSVYAKWSNFALTFKTYPYSGNPYEDPDINRTTAPGLGTNDDHAMRFKIKRTTANTSGVGTSKAFVIRKNVKDAEVYKISYDYKVNANNLQNASMYVMSGSWLNIWWSNINTTYAPTRVKLPAKTDGWQHVEYYVNVNAPDMGYQTADTLYIRFDVPGSSEAGANIDVLFDNMLVELVEAPYVYFEPNNNRAGTMVQGKVGDKITYPKTPVKVGYDFAGWYSDAELTTKFDLEYLAEDTAMNAYAKWNKSNTSVYSFENYTLVDGVGLSIKDGEAVKRMAKTGDYSMYFGNRTPGNYETRSYFAFEDGDEFYRLEKDCQYLITFNYYIKEYGVSPLNMNFVASSANIWHGLLATTGVLGTNQMINPATAKEQKGKWCQKSFAIDTIGLGDYNGIELPYLFTLITGGENWEIYFDDISITKIPKGKSLVVIDAEGAKGVPAYLTGSVGSDFSSKLPETLVNGDMHFKGYYTMTPDGTYNELPRENMKFSEAAMVVYARFLPYEISENFDTGFYGKAYASGFGYTIHDFDYEVYDSEKEGNSKDNVTSGRYSLHRKGTSMYNENSVILTLGNQIAEGERYRVSFKVKLGKHFHTDGAVKIVSSRSYEYAWTTTGDYYAVVPIADLTDGQWHEVSYVFNSVEAFVNVQTPGYVELFMDDFKFELVGEDVALSEPPVYTEYVAAERDANGNLLRVDRTAVDISTIIDSNLGKASFPWLYVIIGVAALIVIAGGVVAFILIKKKKSEKVR